MTWTDLLVWCVIDVAVFAVLTLVMAYVIGRFDP
jgi:hypothetical protein